MKHKRIAIGFLAVVLGSVFLFRNPIVSGVVKWQVGKATGKLPAIDTVHVYFLRGLLGAKNVAPGIESAIGHFSVKPYEDKSYILGETVLDGTDATELAKLWRSQVFDSIQQSLSHFPGYGIRIFKKGRLIGVRVRTFRGVVSRISCSFFASVSLHVAQFVQGVLERDPQRVTGAEYQSGCRSLASFSAPILTYASCLYNPCGILQCVHTASSANRRFDQSRRMLHALATKKCDRCGLGQNKAGIS